MKLNRLLTITAIVQAAPGLLLTFAPKEILLAMGVPTAEASIWIAQMLGAALLGFAFLNWFNRFAVVGGIYGRPVAMPNFFFLLVGFFATLSAWRHQPEQRVFLVVAIVSGVLAVSFAVRMFGPPPRD